MAQMIIYTPHPIIMRKRPIHQPMRCIRQIAHHMLHDRYTVEKSVLCAFERWNRTGTIFEAAEFMIPYCVHPTLRKVRVYLHKLVYPFVIERHELHASMCMIHSLNALEMFFNTYGYLPTEIMYAWCIVHKYIRPYILKEILCSGRLVRF